LRFLTASGTVQMHLTKDRGPFGSFRTELEGGRLTALHHALGGCAEWTRRGWFDREVAEKIAEMMGGDVAPGNIGGDLAEKIMAVIPGTLGLSREP